MFGVSPAELLTIAVVALIVLGPRRLPDASRRAGRALRQLRDTADELRRGIESEADGTDLGEVRRAMPTRQEPPPPPPAEPG